MRVQVLSDMHLEFYSNWGESLVKEVPVAADVLVLAGDITSARFLDVCRNTFSWFCSRFRHVLYVSGNHELYGTSPDDAHMVLSEAAKDFPNLYYLNRGLAVIEGQRFVGATLWFPPTPDEARWRGYLNDFSLIRGFAHWVPVAHHSDLLFLKNNIQPGDVVITHHLPHPACVAPEYIGSQLNRFFVADDASSLVETAGAKAWIFGHTHTPCDMTLGGTRAMCNPVGYPGQERARAALDRVIDV